MKTLWKTLWKKRCGKRGGNAVENVVENSVENGVEHFVSGPILGAVKNAVENLWKIILHKSSEIRRIIFHNFHSVFHKVFHGANFGTRFIFHDCGKRDRRGREQPGRTTAPASPGPSREIPGRLAHPPNASTTIRNLKVLNFSTIIFWGTRGHEARVGGGGVCCLMATLRNANGLWMRCPWSGESFVRAPPNDFSILTQRADGGFSGGEKLARRPLAPVDS